LKKEDVIDFRHLCNGVLASHNKNQRECTI
jgi:hypothetical protein